MSVYETMHNGLDVRIFSGSSLVPHGTMGIHGTMNPEGRELSCTEHVYSTPVERYVNILFRFYESLKKNFKKR